jgi:hypothetical protein
MSDVEVFRTADLVIKQVPSPQNNWCKSGHEVKNKLGEDVEVRFYQVTSKKKPAVDGVYCELCLVIANSMANSKKKAFKPQIK